MSQDKESGEPLVEWQHEGQWKPSNNWRESASVAAWVGACGASDNPKEWHYTSFGPHAQAYRCSWPIGKAPAAPHCPDTKSTGFVRELIGNQWELLNGGRNPGEPRPTQAEVMREAMRDAFAAEALAALVPNVFRHTSNVPERSAREVARLAYVLADAMVAASRERGPAAALHVELLSYGSTNTWLPLADLTNYPEAVKMLEARVTGVVFRSGANLFRVTEVEPTKPAA